MPVEDRDVNGPKHGRHDSPLHLRKEICCVFSRVLVTSLKVSVSPTRKPATSINFESSDVEEESLGARVVSL